MFYGITVSMEYSNKDFRFSLCTMFSFCAFEGMSAAIIVGVAIVTVVYVAAIMVCFLYIRRCALCFIFTH